MATDPNTIRDMILQILIDHNRTGSPDYKDCNEIASAIGVENRLVEAHLDVLAEEGHVELIKTFGGCAARVTSRALIYHDRSIRQTFKAGEGKEAEDRRKEAMNFFDPHVNSRDFWIRETQKWSGTHLYTGYTGKYLRTPRKNRAEMPPCGLGEHNEYVFKAILGLSDKEYTELEREKYIGTAWLT